MYRSYKSLSGALLLGLSGLATPVSAVIVDVTVDGPDAIFLAGRTDLAIPAANLPWPDGMIRHIGATPEEALESLPPFVSVTGGDVIRLLDPADGGINFFNNFGPPYFGPSGNGTDGSNLNSFGGISGYQGPQGPLAGVFLDDNIPDNSFAPPITLDFRSGGMGTDFATLSPDLRQIFYIGDGVNSGGDFQTFNAPTGATRLFLAIPDGFNFIGPPGAYDDNDGAYRVRIGVNEVPTHDAPAPGALVLALLGIAGMGLRKIRRTATTT